ncbi:MAG: OmpA family protein [Saprospiraceae bacterium]|nr:OmpA family protein [Saprospiraceae bacterium]
MSYSIKSFLIVCFVGLLLTGCSFGKKVKTGELAYERKQYAVAVDLLSKEYEESDNTRFRARSAYLLGMSYIYLEENRLAIDWLEKALNKGYGNEALLAVAKEYKKSGDYQSAIDSYEQLKLNSSASRQIDREIYVLREVASWANDEDSEVEIEPINENSGYSEYSPVLLDRNFLVFTSDNNQSTGNDSYKWTGNKHTDLFVMLKNGSDIKRFDAGINTDQNEGTASFSKDGQEMVFVRCYVDGDSDGYCKLMYSERTSGIWAEPQPLPFVENGVNYGHPTFIEDDSVLVFSAEMTDGVGGHDLYYVERYMSENNQVEWGEPFIFPQTVNSAGNEMFPTGDGDTLYFSSDYFAGLGGLDIFKTWLQPNGQWAPPQNLKKPINSSFDDFGLVIDYDAVLRGKIVQKGFFTSTRKGFGKEDIYQFERRKTYVPVTPPPPSDSIAKAEEVVVEIYLAGKTKEVSYENPDDPNSPETGKMALPECYIEINDGQAKQKVYSDEEGRFIVQLEKDKNYTLRASKIGYLNDIQRVSTFNLKIPEGELSTTINVELVLSKIFSNVEITLDNIYYNFNKWNIRDDAKPTLDSLATILLNNPQINVQLSSHTDCRADDQYNSILSQKRAESAVEYMVSKGVPRDRLTAKGYGESQLAVNCNCDDCTEEEHQINRRTTFKILE